MVKTENLILVFTNERLRITNVKFALRLAHLLSDISVFTNERLRFTNEDEEEQDEPTVQLHKCA